MSLPIQLYNDGTHAVALWRLPGAGGRKGLTLRARVPLAELNRNLQRMADARLPAGSEASIGLKITLRSLGRNLVKIGKSKALRRVLIAAGDVAKLHPAIANNPAAMAAINAGQAAIKIRAKADAGDPAAKQIVARALQVANGTVPAGAPIAAPGSNIRRIQRYVVTLALDPYPAV